MYKMEEEENKTKSGITISQRSAALISGFGLLLMAIAAMYAVGFVFPSLIVDGDVTKTTQNILENELLFRSGIASYFIVVLLDLIVAWSLYVFLKQTSKDISLLTAWFRIIYAAVYAAAIFNLVYILKLFGEEGLGDSMENGQMNLFVTQQLDNFNDAWAVGYLFFGPHLFLLGYLAFRSGFIPKIFGILLLLAGASYFIDYFGVFLIPGFNLNSSLIFGWGELIFMFWLIYWGFKKPKKEEAV